MPIHDDLGTRMKTYYEGIPQLKGDGRRYLDELIMVGE